MYLDCVKRLESDLLRIARSFAPLDLDTAQDLVQEVVVKGFQYYREGRLDLGLGIKSWFGTAIRHEHLMRLRKDKRLVRSVEITDDPGTGPSVSPASALGNPHDALESSSISPALVEEIMALPDIQRQVVVLVDLEELSYEEAAEVLEIPVGTVRSRLFRGRMKLACALAPLYAGGAQ